jgi:ornithine cyclodeaminase/alanine dehydrogenase-like protein (mu-crystallin family)
MDKKKYITEKEVMENLKVKDLANALENEYRKYSTLGTLSFPRTEFYYSGGLIRMMPSAIIHKNIAGLKIGNLIKDSSNSVINSSSLSVIFSIETGCPIAIIESNYLSRIRTGAMVAMVTSNLLNEKTPKIAIIGSGKQAEAQIDAYLEILNPESINIYSRAFEHANSLAENMSRKSDIPIKASSNLKNAIEGCHVITTITNSRIPIIYKDLLPQDSFHLNLVGSNFIYRREATPSVFMCADLICTDSIEQVDKESSELSDKILKNWGLPIAEVGNLISNGEIKQWRGKKTIFKSLGNGVQDIVACSLLIEKMGINFTL